MVNNPDRVALWASELKAGAVPPVCVITGQPAEAWFKVRFISTPEGAEALVLLGLLGHLIRAAVSRSARGVLPTTVATKRRMRNVQLLGWGALVALIVSPIIAGIASDQAVGIGFLAGFVIALGLGTWAVVVNLRLRRPRGQVVKVAGQPDYLVELQRVHPEFVAAVNAMREAHAIQRAAYQPVAQPVFG